MSHYPDLAPRKLPGQRRSAATVGAIIEAAAHILECDGPGSYSTNAIAERAGASIGSLYQYFPNKDAITRTLIVREKAALRDSMVLIDNRLPGSERLRALIVAGIEAYLRRPVLAPLLEVEEVRFPGDPRIQQLNDEMAAVFQAILDDMAVTGGNAHVIGDLVAIICGMVRSASARGETEMLAERVTSAAFGYLGIRRGCDLKYPF